MQHPLCGHVRGVKRGFPFLVGVAAGSDVEIHAFLKGLHIQHVLENITFLSEYHNEEKAA
jgi:hypothetical protein